jgi:hypothetical protein
MKSSSTLSTTATLLPTPSTSTSRTKKAWTALKRHAKEHHESVNAAYSLYYGQGNIHMARRTGAVEIIGYSGNSNVKVMEEGHRMDRDREESTAKKAWKKVKTKAKLRHQGNDAAFEAYYWRVVGLRVDGV